MSWMSHSQRKTGFANSCSGPLLCSAANIDWLKYFREESYFQGKNIKQHQGMGKQMPRLTRSLWNRIFQLEGPYSDHLVQLPGHFRAAWKLKHGIKGTAISLWKMLSVIPRMEEVGFESPLLESLRKKNMGLFDLEKRRRHVYL